MAKVRDIEMIEDRTARARCDEGFLHVRRLTCRNRRADGSVSASYPVDVVDRPTLDAVAVVIWRREEAGGVEILIRENLRPAAYFRKDKAPPLPDPRVYVRVPEIVAGILEAPDRGVEGLRRRAAEEVAEEAGFEVAPEEIEVLGGPFFLAPGILSEKIHLTAVDVGRRPQTRPMGDGSPLEEDGALRWLPLEEAVAACASGEIEDAKTEIGLRRLVDRLPGGGAPLLA